MIEATEELGPVSEAIVADSVRISAEDQDEVRRITLRIKDPTFQYQVGQSIGVVVPGPHPMGNPYHTRRYAIANGHKRGLRKRTELELLVRRCFSIDEINGELYPGIASNFLCDAKKGQKITITGPYRSPFNIPQDDRANLLMIGTGTGVAPFRCFIQEIYRDYGIWRGQVRLYYGVHSGMDLLYENDEQDDFTNYYDQASFKAFRSLIGQRTTSEEDSLKKTLDGHVNDIWSLMQDPNTYVYLGGLSKIAIIFDHIMGDVAGDESDWLKFKDKLRAEGRWSELVYN